jgi:hypothetical protein
MAFLPVGTPLAWLTARAIEATGSYVPVLSAFFRRIYRGGGLEPAAAPQRITPESA